ncbi:MAG TPA: hypothetical protein P5065_02670 [Candidatus Ratteibacteria bacterium]|jgi:hypothetical protein|uniref:Uncharacterized protein n=1 Tax=candidate division TA06 bacterium ADurb.Bin131 TaxID=1852827 RepID=A0A1V6CDW4_UNCT6|nr:MAG: hypothetical protein BWX89_00176 [candidate division TA06 bacterium ADurb.Bin131]HOC01981.1 hypothetical protein [bacterium]HRS05930.1 hypothetical protein [Candidatus Ratteibacteria bacterium]HON05486.1 hypothetical protein [bacterium]HOQ81779.1 hypothetical protein [bacterium]
MESEGVFGPLRQMSASFWLGLARLLAALLTFIIGWLIAKLIYILVVKGLQKIKLDKFSEESGLKSFLDKGKIEKTASELIGIAVYWIVILTVIFLSINVAGLSLPPSVIDAIIGFIPRFIIGLIIFVLSLFIGKLFRGIVLTAASNAGIKEAEFLARITQIAIVVFGVVIAIQEFNIAAEFIASVFIILLASLCFGAALTFALGAKDIAKQWIESMFQKK